jgi:hypothetical protein
MQKYAHTKNDMMTIFESLSYAAEVEKNVFKK